MGNKPSSPSDCSTIMDCHKKRAEAVKTVLTNAYADHTLTVHFLVCVLFMIIAAVSFLMWRVRRIDRDVHKLKVTEGTRNGGDAEKGGFVDAFGARHTM